jgi:hypothetical protein
MEVHVAEQHKSSAISSALIGLVGTFLTVCGGLSGALITSAIAVYQVERESQQVALAAPDGGEALNVDTSTIIITRQDAAGLDPEVYYVNLEQGFILHRPLAGWDVIQEMTVEEQLAEDNITCLAVCDQPVFRIRYGEPIEVESDRATTVNGHPIPDNLLNQQEMFYGPPPWNVPFYSQMILNVFSKEVVQELGIDNLADMILFMTSSFARQVNRIAAPEGSQFALVQFTSTYEGIRMAGEATRLTVDDWILFAETEAAYYMLEISYTFQSGQSIQVWDDLQTYIDEFRVIE